MNEQSVFYFAPHQDDELTNFGPAVVRDLAAGLRVFCVLCTDGSASGARRLIGNGETCRLHPGRHPDGMDVPAFVAARDREFRESCRLMGLAEEGILLPENRARDGALTVDHAEALMQAAIGDRPPETVTVKTLLPVEGMEQNPDHTAVGRAAQRLFAAGAFGDLCLFYEPIHYNRGLLEGRRLRFVRPGTPAQRQRLLDSADMYGRWAPEDGFFAVGQHSVFDEFADFMRDPFALEAESLPKGG